MPEGVASSLDTLSILSAAPAPYLVLLPDAPRYTIVAVTGAYLQATFTTREAIVGKGLFEVFPDNPDWPKATGVANLQASLDSVLRTKQEHRMAEQRYDVAAGEDGEFTCKVWLPLNRPVLDEEGEVQYIIHYVEDITEKVKGHEQMKQREAAEANARVFLESRRFMEQVMEATPDFITVFSLLTGKVEFINRSGYKDDEARYRETLQIDYEQILQRAHPDDRASLHQFIEDFKTAQDDEIRSLEYRVVRDSEVLWYRARGKVFMRNAAGEPTHYISILQDITESKTAAETLLQMKEELAQQATDKYLALFNSIDEGFCIIEVLYDEQGYPRDYRYLDVNPAFEKLSGLQHPVGKTIKELFPVSNDSLIQKFAEVSITGQPVRLTYYVQHLDRWFELYATAIPGSSHVAVLFNDITERKRAEEALLKSEEQLRFYVSATTDVLYKMSGNWEQMFYMDGKGLLVSIETPRSDWMEEYIPQDERAKVATAIGEALRTKSVFNLEHRVKGADGEVHWVHARAVPLLDEEGHIVEWFGAVTNITLRKEAEQQLRAFAALLEQQVAERTQVLQEQAHYIERVVNNVPDTIFILNLPEQRNLFANPEAESLLGYTPDELRELGPGALRRLIHPADWEAQSSLLALLNHMHDGDTQEVEYRVVRKDGGVRWVQVRRSVFRRNERGEVIQVIAIMHDITPLKQAEQELKDEHYFLEQVTDKSPHLIYVFDLDEQRFTYINKRVEQLVGRDQEYVYAMGPHLFQAIIHPADLLGREAYMNSLATLNEQEIRDHEFRIWTGSSFRWFRSKDSIFKNEDGVVKQVIGLAEDVTYEKMVQEKIQREGGHRGLN